MSRLDSLTSALNQAASVLDQAVAVVNPRAAVLRRLDRERLRLLDKQSQREMFYAAAKTNRMTGVWSPGNESVNDIIGASSETVRARVRQLVRDFPILTNACRKIQNYTVGGGMEFQSRVRMRSKDGVWVLDTDTIERIEEAWERWGEEADVAGKLHINEMMSLAKRQDAEAGEFVLVKTKLREPGRFLSFALQMYEPDWLANFSMTPTRQSDSLEQGIQFDPATGRVTAYHFTDPADRCKVQVIPAQNVIHGFETLRPGQLRGISVFAAAVLLARDVQEMMDAELDASKMAAKYLAFVTTPDPAGRQNPLVRTDPDTQQKIEELENGIIEYLRTGEQVELAHNPRPGSNFGPFIKLCLRFAAVATGIPYEILSGDYEGLNYSGARVIRNDFAVDLRPLHVRHVRQFCNPVFRAFMDEAVMEGRLTLPEYWLRREHYQRCVWQPPGVAPVDPLKEGKADADAIKARTKSPQEICRARGRNLEDVLREISEAYALAEQLGIPFALDGISTSTANNPAAVETQGKNGNGRVEAGPLRQLLMTRGTNTEGMHDA